MSFGVRQLTIEHALGYTFIRHTWDVAIPAKLSPKQYRFDASSISLLEDCGIRHSVLPLMWRMWRRQRRWKLSSFLTCRRYKNVHVSLPYSRVVSTTARYTWTLVSTRIPWSFHKRFLRHPKAAVALANRAYISSSSDQVRYVYATAKVAEGFCNRKRVCRWWLLVWRRCCLDLVGTTLFFKLTERPKRLEAITNWSNSVWASCRVCAARAQSSPKTSSRTGADVVLGFWRQFAQSINQSIDRRNFYSAPYKTWTAALDNVNI